METKKPKPIVEESEECMVSVTGGNPTLRTARFLHPFVTSVDEESMGIPPHVPPLLSEIISYKSVENWPLEVQFKGWRVPQRKWKQWVDKLVQIHEPIWRKACIYDAIMASTYNVKKDENLVFGLAELWCPETNTFVFPWGEATVTLEDMLILGGFSVLGEPVTSPLDENLLKINDMINEERKKRPSCFSWINHFMENYIDRNVQHIMFLVLWLSRYVFQRPPQDHVGRHVFSIAAHLAQGTRIALAPAVLSRLYRDLSILKKNVVVSSDSCDVWGMFHILQLWVWEHFPPLRPEIWYLHRLREGEPRIARWHDMKTSFGLQIVRSVLKSPENFQWRCYATNVINWRHPSFYNEEEMWVLDDSNIDDELRSFAQCLVASELVGIDCIEQYLPHRVAMQFGLDQDLPGCFTRANSKWEYAWETYNKPTKTAFYIPPRLFESDVTTRYLEWWKQSMKIRSGETTENLLHQRSIEVHKGVENESRNESHGSGPPGIATKNKKHILQEDGRLESCSHELPISQSLKLLGNSTEVVNLPVTWEKPSSCSTQSQTSLPLMILSNTETKGKSSTAIPENDASTASGDKFYLSNQSHTSLQPSMVLGNSETNGRPSSNTETKGRSSTAIPENNASTASGDKPSLSNQSHTSLQPSMVLGNSETNGRPSSSTETKGRSSTAIPENNASTASGDKPSLSNQSDTSLQPSMVLGNSETNGRPSSNTETKGKSPTAIPENNASTASGDKPSLSNQSHTSLQPSMVLGSSETNGRPSTVVAEKNESIRGDKAGDSTQNALGVGRATATSGTDQYTELEDRVLKLENFFARLKAMKAKVVLKKTTES